jgi:hypothetical protein
VDLILHVLRFIRPKNDYCQKTHGIAMQWLFLSMTAIKIGLIREGKVPPDKRVPFTPTQVQEIRQRFPQVEIQVQQSNIRCFRDDEYKEFDTPVVVSLADCDIILKKCPSRT